MLFSKGVKFLIFIGMNVGGTAGWAAGEPFGIFTALLASGVGSAVGVYLAWRFARAHLG